MYLVSKPHNTPLLNLNNVFSHMVEISQIPCDVTSHYEY